MTVAELMEALTTMPPDAIVLQRGYETGCDIVRDAQLKTVYKRSQPEHWNGEYETDSYWATSSQDGIEAVVLGESN